MLIAFQRLPLSDCIDSIGFFEKKQDAYSISKTSILSHCIDSIGLFEKKQDAYSISKPSIV